MDIHENPSLRELFSGRGQSKYLREALSRYPVDETLSQRLVGGTPLEQAIWQQAQQFMAVEESLRQKIAYAQDEMERALRYMGAGQTINPLGILQSTGVEIDRLCGKRAQHIESLVMLLALAGREAEAATA